MVRLTLALLFLLSLAVSPALCQTSHTLTPYPVLRVIDGDTLRLLTPSGSLSVRLLGVDTPELHHPRKHKQPGADEAASFLRSLADGTSVSLVCPPGFPSVDRYGRSLAYVLRYPDNYCLNSAIVLSGYSRAYGRFRHPLLPQFRALEAIARASRSGLWRSTWKDN